MILKTGFKNIDKVMGGFKNRFHKLVVVLSIY